MSRPPAGRLRPAPAFDCELEVLPGLEGFAADELRSCCGEIAHLSPRQEHGALRFRYGGDLDDLIDLRSVTAAYLVRRFNVPRPRALLANQHLGAIVEAIDQVRALWTERSFSTLRLSAAGEGSGVMQRLRDELAGRTRLTISPDEGDLLLRLRPGRDGSWEALVRLSPRPLATRPWRVCNLPGALNAPVAHVMMQLTAPGPSDRVVNLCCGSGTLLIERLALGPARSAIGCDVDAPALACARRNLAAAGLVGAARLERWDAGDLPLTDATVDVLCADLPFGQLVGSHEANEALYPRLLAEATRVATGGARMALITHEVRLLERSLAPHAGRWRREQEIRIRVSGMAPRIYLLRRM